MPTLQPSSRLTACPVLFPYLGLLGDGTMWQRELARPRVQRPWVSFFLPAGPVPRLHHET